MGSRLVAEGAADAVVGVHLAFVAFLLAGGYLAWRWRALLWAHVPAAAISTALAVTGAECPLSAVEKWFRRRAGQTPYREGFIAHYLVEPVHAAGLTPTIAAWLRVLTIGIVAVAYLGLIARWWWAGGRSGPDLQEMDAEHRRRPDHDHDEQDEPIPEPTTARRSTLIRPASSRRSS